MDCFVDDCDSGKADTNPYDSGGHKGVRFSLSRERARNKTAQKVREVERDTKQRRQARAILNC